MKYIIKIGGSLYARPELDRVMRHAAGLIKAPHSAVIVPGGGPFADQVRRAQKRWLFPDETAHRMALLAMRQYGRMLAALSDLPAAEQLQKPEPGGCTVWLPSEDPAIWLPQNCPAPDFDWRLTSDSIAACLAERLGADWLVLVKPVSVAEAESFSDLVDERFCGLVEDSGVRVACVSVLEWLGVRYITDIEGKIA